MSRFTLFCGLTTVDIQHFVDEFPNSNQKIKTSEPEICVGGPAANAAITHSFLGAYTHFASVVGKNTFTGFVYDDFLQNRVKIIDFAENERCTPVVASIITTVKNGDRAVISHLPKSIVPSKKLTQSIDFSQCNMVVIDGFYPEITMEICEEAKKFSVPVLFDGGSWKPHTNNVLQYVDIAICSEQFMPPSCSNLHDVFNFLRDTGVEKIAITRGEKSILWKDQHLEGTIEIENLNAIDSLGAGDVFHGAFAYFYGLGNNFQSALKFSASIASFSTKYKGTRSWMEHYQSVCRNEKI